MLENVRFHNEETKNDPAFSKELASLADVYVNDAFGTAHTVPMPLRRAVRITCRPTAAT